jgi:cytoskeleton protein RodZ
VVASGPAGSAAAAARKPVTANKAARTHPAATSTPAPPAAHHGSPGALISLTAVSEACWADLTTPGGATIFQGIIGPGTSKTWTERQAVTLELGNPGAVTLTVDGTSRTGFGSQPVTLSLGPGQGVSG